MKKIILSGEVGWEITADSVREEFKGVGKTEDVDIEINSPGGSVFEGIEISNIIKNHKGKTTVTIGSLAASMGSVILMSADVKKAYRNSSFMIHNASSFAWGDHRELRKTANLIESLTNMLSKSYIKQTGKTQEEISALMDDETWLFGDEILDAGFIDEILDAEDEKEKDEAVAISKLAVQSCNEKLKSDNRTKEDLNKASAYFKNLSAIAKQEPKAKDPEKKIMNFDEFLASSPAAMAEFNTRITAAKAEVKEKNKEIVAKISGIITSDSYGAAIKAAGVKVLSGEKDYSSFEDLVALSDEFTEKQKSAEVQENQPEPTPAVVPAATEPDKTVNSAEMQAQISEQKKILGVK